MMHSIHRALAALMLVALLALVGCQPASRPAAGGGAASSAPAAPAPAQAPGGNAAPQAAPAASAVPSGPPEVVHVGVPGSFTDAGLAIGIAQGYFQQQNLEVDPQRLDSAAKMIPFVSTGQLDVAGGGPGAGLFQAFARGVDLKIVADKGTAGTTQSYACYLVRKELVDSGQVKTEADLKGLRFAAAAPGVSLDLPTHRMLLRGGLTEQDLTTNYMSYPDMVSALAAGSIDVANTLEPSCARAVTQGVAVRWRSSADYAPDQTTAMLLFSPQFGQNRETATRFLVAYLQGIRDYRKAYLEGDAALRQKLDPIMVEWTGIDARVFDAMVFPELAADGAVNVQSLEDLQNYELETGQIQERIDLSKYIDASYREAAVRRLDGR